MRKALTDRGIKALKTRAQAYIVFDAVVPGLGVRVMPSGFKSFVFVARYPGAKHPAPKSLGIYGELTLERARGKARTWMELLGQGMSGHISVDSDHGSAVSHREHPARGEVA